MRLWAVLCFVLTLVPCAAQASVERFAVIIGSNRGQPDDQELRYAESDAAHIFEVLRDLGGFQPANMVLLRIESADTILRTLITVNDRIRAATSPPEGQALLSTRSLRKRARHRSSCASSPAKLSPQFALRISVGAGYHF